MRRRFCFLFLMLCVLSSLSAEEVHLSWSHRDTEVSLYRWRRGNEEWNVTQIPEAQSSYRYGDVEIYHIEASYDGERWSDDHPILISEKDTVAVSWSWKDESEGVRFHRYRINEGEWTVINAPGTETGPIELAVGERYGIEVQASFDGSFWSEISSSVLTTVKAEKRKPFLSFELSSSISLSYALYDFYNGHDIAGARYLMKTDPSFTADGELLLSLGKRFRLFAGYAYSRERKRETVIPDAFVVEHHQAVTGFDVLFPINEKWRLYTGLSAAYSVDVNAGYWSPAYFFGGRIGLDYFISEHFYVGIKSGVRVAHNDAEDPLYRSYTYLLDPIGIKMGLKF